MKQLPGKVVETAVDPNEDVRFVQFVFTHCSREDSCDGHEGYGIRARTDESDPKAEDLVTGLPSYSLPEHTKAEATPENSPQNLIFQSIGGDRRILANTVFVESDALGRRGTFLVHSFSGSGVGLGEAVGAWQSKDWKREFQPGESKTLDMARPLPANGTLSVGLVSEFLRGPGDQQPEQLSSLADFKSCGGLSSTNRHALVEAVVQIVLQSHLQVTDEGDRSGVVINAEPEAVALLVFILSRVFPSSLVDDVTFATYLACGPSLNEMVSRPTVVGTLVTGPDAERAEAFLGQRARWIDPRKECSYVPFAEELPGSLKKLIEKLRMDQPQQLELLHELWPALESGNPDDWIALAEEGENLEVITHPGSDAETVVHAVSRLLKRSFADRILKQLGNRVFEALRQALILLPASETVAKFSQIDGFSSFLSKKAQQQFLSESEGNKAWVKTWKVIHKVIRKDELSSLARVVTIDEGQSGLEWTVGQKQSVLLELTRMRPGVIPQLIERGPALLKKLVAVSGDELSNVVDTIQDWAGPQKAGPVVGMWVVVSCLLQRDPALKSELLVNAEQLFIEGNDSSREGFIGAIDVIDQFKQGHCQSAVTTMITESKRPVQVVRLLARLDGSKWLHKEQFDKWLSGNRLPRSRNGEAIIELLEMLGPLLEENRKGTRRLWDEALALVDKRKFLKSYPVGDAVQVLERLESVADNCPRLTRQYAMAQIKDWRRWGQAVRDRERAPIWADPSFAWLVGVLSLVVGFSLGASWRTMLARLLQVVIPVLSDLPNDLLGGIVAVFAVAAGALVGKVLFPSSLRVEMNSRHPKKPVKMV